MSNSDNPFNGAKFQGQVKEWFISHFDKPFNEEVKIKIGSPLVKTVDYKDHKFDSHF